MLEDEYGESPDLLDCLVEIHEIKENAKRRSDDNLVKFICESTGKLDLDKRTEKAIDLFFQTGYLTEKQRQLIENCYVALENTLCWVEPADKDGDAGVYHAIFLRK